MNYLIITASLRRQIKYFTKRMLQRTFRINLLLLNQLPVFLRWDEVILCLCLNFLNTISPYVINTLRNMTWQYNEFNESKKTQPTSEMCTRRGLLLAWQSERGITSSAYRSSSVRGMANGVTRPVLPPISGKVISPALRVPRLHRVIQWPPASSPRGLKRWK